MLTPHGKRIALQRMVEDTDVEVVDIAFDSIKIDIINNDQLRINLMANGEAIGYLYSACGLQVGDSVVVEGIQGFHTVFIEWTSQGKPGR